MKQIHSSIVHPSNDKIGKHSVENTFILQFKGCWSGLGEDMIQTFRFGFQKELIIVLMMVNSTSEICSVWKILVKT